MLLIYIKERCAEVCKDSACLKEVRPSGEENINEHLKILTKEIEESVFYYRVFSDAWRLIANVVKKKSQLGLDVDKFQSGRYAREILEQNADLCIQGENAYDKKHFFWKFKFFEDILVDKLIRLERYEEVQDIRNSDIGDKNNS